jgi:hypothetical protein
MADQSVRIVDNSRERVALDLMNIIRNVDSEEKDTRQAILDLYHTCRSIVYGASPN